MADIPVYLVTGFLDAGKTNFINGILEDGFARQDPTLLLCCEEGEEEYEKNALDNVTVITIEDEEDLKCSYLKELEKQYRPQQVLIEYNGMWQMERLYREVLPANWVLYQIMTFVYAPTFDMYAKNMGQLMMEKITNADMIVFNRCTPELRDALRKRNLRMVNRRADIYLENTDGTSEDYMDGTVSAFDLTADPIVVTDEDYGFWFVEIMDNPKMYEGKRVRFRAMMCKPPRYGDYFTPGRFAMVCCAEDMNFLAVACIGYDVKDIPERTWVEITAVCRVEHWDPYGEEDGPVLHVERVVPCEKPKEEVVQM